MFSQNSMVCRRFASSIAASARQVRSKSGHYMQFGAVGLLGAVVFGAGATMADGEVSADELVLHAPHMHWEHKEKFKSYNHASLRRGFQVYKEVCQACHSMQYLCFRHHVDVAYTADEMKEIAAEYQYKEVNDDGDVVERPGNLQDYLPSPYENEIKARLANNGANPPDLTQIVIAREGKEDYIFGLLNGYEEIPEGQKDADEGQAYNPYFHGYYLGMAQQIYNETVDYEDGTIPYKSQIAKDVTEYLAWCSDPYMDTTKLYGMKAVATMGTMVLLAYLYKRNRMNHFRTRLLHYTKPGQEKSITANGVVNNTSKYNTVNHIDKMQKK